MECTDIIAAGAPLISTLCLMQNMAYVVVSGASRKNERWEEKEGETVSVEGHSEAQKLASDAMYRLEHGVEDKTKADEAAPRIARIMVCVFAYCMHLCSQNTTLLYVNRCSSP